jgi:hypothetical protein
LETVKEGLPPLTPEGGSVSSREVFPLSFDERGVSDSTWELSTAISEQISLNFEIKKQNHDE